MNTAAPFDPNPPGFRAEDLNLEAEGFLPVTDLARKNGLTPDEAIKAIQRNGWELRAFGSTLHYRPAILTRMGRP